MQPTSKYQIEDAIQSFCRTFPSLKPLKTIRYQDLTDGHIFVQILKTIPDLKFSNDELDQTENKWILKLGNLKKLLKKLQNYCITKLNKNLITKDIDLIQMTKNSSAEEILKYFELIIAMLMQSHKKDQYIEKIMCLDEKSQTIFVNIIQNAMDNRMTISTKLETIKLQDEIKMLKKQNEHLREEISFFVKANKGLKIDMQQVRQQLKQKTQELQAVKYGQIQRANETLNIQLTQQRNLTQNLKIKLISIARQHELQISRYQQQISLYQIRLQNLEQLQNNLEMYKQRYTQVLKDGYRKQEIEKEKKKLVKELQEKDSMIKKLNDKIEEYETKRQNMEENQIYMKMELQKKEVRFKQLEKEVRTRLNKDDKMISAVNIPSTILEQSLDDERLETHLEEMQFLKAQIQKLRNSNRELQRENLKNKKRLQKLNELQKQKKKLERMILQVSKSRDAQIEMLVVSMWQLRNQNVKIFQMLQNSQQNIVNE